MTVLLSGMMMFSSLNIFVYAEGETEEENTVSDTTEAVTEEEPTETKKVAKEEDVFQAEEAIIQTEIFEKDHEKDEVIERNNNVTGSTDGNAYAVLTNGNELVFFRSTEEYENDTSGTFIDISGNEYDGTVYSGIESLAVTDYIKIPWYWDNDAIETSKIAEGQIIKPQSMAYWFYDCSNLTTIDFEGLETNLVTDMQDMFYHCDSLTSLDLSSFDTGNVTNMSSMFMSCSGLEEIDLSGFDTGKVNNMSAMFSGCNKLKTIDLSDFDTGNVTDMSRMFVGCSSLSSLDLSDFDTGNVSAMDWMFYNCSGLTSLDVSGFDTRNVKNMSSMFNNCSNLTSLDISDFDTGNVTDMGAMFIGCSSLVNLDLSNFNTSKVTRISSVNGMTIHGYSYRGMFEGCRSLIDLDISSFDTSHITSMGNMFEGCTSLTELDLKNFDTASVTDMTNMFQNCSNLASLDITSFDTGKVIDMSEMFSNCSSLIDLDLSNFDTGNVTYMIGMFMNCRKLNSLDLSTFDTGNVKQLCHSLIGGMFQGCESLQMLNLSGFDTSKIESMENMLAECDSLESVTLGSGFTKWISDAYLPEGTWTNREINLSLSNIELYNQYPDNAAVYKGEWKRFSVTGVLLDQVSLQMSVNDVKTLNATVIPEDAKNQNVTWTSSNPKIAEVDENGTVTGKKAGKAVITVTTEDGGFTAECEVTINSGTGDVISVELNKTDTKLRTNGSETLIATIEPEDAENQNVTWTSDNEEVATVDDTGKVTGKKPGTANITVTTEDGGYTDTCKVTVLFDDVTQTSQYYYDAVYWAVEKTITQGMGPTSFNPGGLCKRYQFVLFLWRQANCPEPTETEDHFTDVLKDPNKEIYEKAVLWAVENKITTGTTPTTFEPYAPLTRGQVVTFLYRAADGDKDSDIENPFKDVDSSKYYYTPVLWAVKHEITTGVKPDQFQPTVTCTRGQTVLFMYRQFGKE